MNQVLIKGTPASTGTATGRVRIVWSSDDAARFEVGDVLVSEKTDPTMVIMMGKAAAIVTDIGGVTSHAAIISREMGVPCIVATKIATTALKNGQLVTVDGDNGIVVVEG